ncbi:MAG: hypothetical protein L3J35_03235 [Bacteroidales bacterium]|nr:hypothetical protein [Bacteroidales bacterium]
MNKLLISILALVVFSQSNIYAQKTNDNSKSTGFVLKKNRPSFSIRFPSEYKLEESSENKGLKTEFYKSFLGEDIFMFKFSEHKNPAVSSDNEVYLNASVESFVNGVGGSIVNKDNIKYKKTNAIDAFITIDDKNLNVFYRVLIINHVQYQLIVITKSNDKTSVIQNYFNSFNSPVK